MKLPLSKCFVIYYIAQKLCYFTLTICHLATDNGVLVFVSALQ